MPKRYGALTKEKPSAPVALPEAVSFVRKHANAKFDETIDLHAHLGVEPEKSDQAVRGTVLLPHGTPSSVRVAVFTNDRALQAAAKAAGADIVGGEELIEQVKTNGKLDADVAVATPDAMKDLATIAKVLGPKGLMPNPKSGTIGPDPTKIVRELKGGKTAFKMDDSGNVHLAVGKASWPEEKLLANARAALDALRQARPAAAKGEFLKSVTVTSTMGVGVRVKV
ncbi:MAG: large subunit ribosomal protein L1 [Parcubacteria group bacterium Gr01-1014_38]|nr:MAG: large subunit ribosomal protein L1 [Parcubacteria group bacterium Gr01-1014_38]